MPRRSGCAWKEEWPFPLTDEMIQIVFSVLQAIVVWESQNRAFDSIVCRSVGLFKLPPRSCHYACT